MSFYSEILIAFAAIFSFILAYVAWLKLREHHHILHDEHQHRQKSHVTFLGRILPGRKRQ